MVPAPEIQVTYSLQPMMIIENVRQIFIKDADAVSPYTHCTRSLRPERHLSTRSFVKEKEKEEGYFLFPHNTNPSFLYYLLRINL